MPYLRMRDFFTFKPKEVSNQIFECKDSNNESGSSLLVRVAATHSGTVNSNHRFYRPDRMQDAAHQWVPQEGKGYAKPVLVEHNQKGDVLGRVRTARYVDESYKWAGDFPIIKDSIFYKASDKKVDLFKSVDWIVENLMPISDYSGLGYIELGLNITNPDGLGKVLRDEYLTVSVGFKTGSAICSVCHTDWATDDKCEHRPGSKDSESGKSAFLICGDFIYEELSFVNFPADPFAGKISKDALKDSLNRKFFMGLSHDKQQAFAAAAGMSMSDALLDYDIQLVEDKVATVYDLSKLELQNAFEAEVKDETLTAARAFELKQVLSDWKPETEDSKTRRRSLTSTLNAKIRKNSWTGVTAEVEDEIQAVIKKDEVKADCACGNKSDDNCTCETDWTRVELAADEKDYFADEDGLYNELCIEMDEAVKAGELTEADIKDAKLSSEQRGKLSGSTFCGPGRSFPVPDCAHVVAARRLIGRYKGGSKDKILACVSRKAASLSCGSTKKKDEVVNSSEKSDTNNNQIGEIAQLVIDAKMEPGCSAEVVGHYDSLNGHYKKADDDLKSRMSHLHYRVGEHWSSTSALEWAKQYVKAHDKDSVMLPVAELNDQVTKISSLTEEVSTLQTAVDASKATSAEMLKAVKKGYATQIVIYRTLTGHADYKELDQTSRDAKIDELSKRHVTSLKDAVADIISELKWGTSITAKPADRVDEPGKSVSDNAQVTETDTVEGKTTEPETEAEKLKKLTDAEATLRTKLRYMSGSERVKYLTSLQYEEAAKKRK